LPRAIWHNRYPFELAQEVQMHTTGLTWTDLNDGFVVAIHIEAKSGEADAVAALLADLVAPTMAELGVKLFIPYRSPTSPAMFFVFELYVDQAAWGARQETAHFNACIKELLPRVMRRERVPFVPYVPAVR
jgi:quinol monooxygenase YgiN